MKLVPWSVRTSWGETPRERFCNHSFCCDFLEGDCLLTPGGVVEDGQDILEPHDFLQEGSYQVHCDSLIGGVDYQQGNKGSFQYPSWGCELTLWTEVTKNPLPPGVPWARRTISGSGLRSSHAPDVPPWEWCGKAARWPDGGIRTTSWVWISWVWES